MPTMYVLQGLPASGKSTWRKQSGLAYVNKDEIRELLGYPNEAMVSARLFSMMDDYAQLRVDFVNDNTNLNPKTVARYRAWADKNGYKFQLVPMKTSLSLCLYYDELRAVKGERSVGKDVIRGMALQYGLTDLPDVWIFDIDGTLADCSHRIKYLQETPKNWKSFFSEMHLDTPKDNIISIYKALENDGYDIICVSGRPEREGDLDTRAVTRAWLKKHGLDPYVLLMRRNRDYREDSIVKQEIYDTYLKNKMNICGVFDDRDRVVAMWRANGLTCMQVAEGAF